MKFHFRRAHCDVAYQLLHRRPNGKTVSVPVFRAIPIVKGKDYRGRLGAKDRARMEAANG